MDRFYTSDAVARALISQATLTMPRIIADFAAGDGALLKVANRRWPNAMLVGTDLDRKAVQQLKQAVVPVSAGICNFLEPRSRSKSKVLRRIEGRADLVLLNPPFTCPGSTQYAASLGLVDLRCSLAMAFIIGATRYLGCKGEILAILPKSCLVSEKDEAALAALRDRFQIRILGETVERCFAGCDSSTDLVHFVPVAEAANAVASERGPINRGDENVGLGVSLFRGKLSMPVKAGSKARDVPALPFVHTTELQNGRVNLGARKLCTKRSVVRGPAILLPRVGRPQQAKLVLFSSSEFVALSDCVIAITSNGPECLNELYAQMSSRWLLLERLYAGTGAKYLTLRRLSQLLRSEFGVDVKRQQTRYDAEAKGAAKPGLSKIIGSNVAEEIRAAAVLTSEFASSASAPKVRRYARDRASIDVTFGPLTSRFAQERARRTAST